MKISLWNMSVFCASWIIIVNRFIIRQSKYISSYAMLQHWYNTGCPRWLCAHRFRRLVSWIKSFSLPTTCVDSSISTRNIYGVTTSYYLTMWMQVTYVRFISELKTDKISKWTFIFVSCLIGENKISYKQNYPIWVRFLF